MSCIPAGIISILTVQTLMEYVRLCDLRSLLHICKELHEYKKEHSEQIFSTKLVQLRARGGKRKVAQEMFYEFSTERLGKDLPRLTYIASRQLSYQLYFLSRVVLPQLKRGDLFCMVFSGGISEPDDSPLDVQLALSELHAKIVQKGVEFRHWEHFGPKSNNYLMKHSARFPNKQRVVALCGQHGDPVCPQTNCIEAREALVYNNLDDDNLKLCLALRWMIPDHLAWSLRTPNSASVLIVQRPTLTTRNDDEFKELELLLGSLWNMSSLSCTYIKFISCVQAMLVGDSLVYFNNGAAPGMIGLRRIDEY